MIEFIMHKILDELLYNLYLEDNLRYMNITSVWTYDIDTYLVCTSFIGLLRIIAK